MIAPLGDSREVRGHAPYFSIIIPMHNRARFIARALNSCLHQDFADFEIIVVDDGSTDRSVEVMKRFADPRIKLICHEENRGACPSRNTGMYAAQGEWFVFLDSDDELLPGALRRIRERAVGVGDDVGSMRFMCQDEAGQLSPAPGHRDEVLDYAGYVRWMEETARGKQEALPCVHRCTLSHVQYPDDRSTEGLYHLNIARLYSVLVCSDVVRLYHGDADNRLIRPVPRRPFGHARDAANNVDTVLNRHGDAIGQWAPTVATDMLRHGALYHFLAGNRIKGLQYALRHLRSRPGSLGTLIIVIAGMLGRVPLSWLQAARWRIRARR